MSDMLEVIKYSQDLTLLYVEDNPEARESTMLIFDEFFRETVVAVNGEDGLEKFKTHNIDIVITDINMPRLNGLEMTKMIKEIDEDIPILVLSAYNESGFFMDSIKLGVEGYLLKPIDMDQFLMALSKVTDRLKLKEEALGNLHFLQQYEKATNSSSIVSKTDLDGLITYVNDAFCNISEYNSDELIGKNHNIIRHPDNKTTIYKDMWHTIKDKKEIWKGLVRNRSKSAKSYYLKSTIIPIVDIDNNILEYIALRDDVTDIMNPKKQLDDALNSYSDPLIVYIKLEEFDTLEEFHDNKTVEDIQDKICNYLQNNLPAICKFEKVYQLGNGEYALVQDKSICSDDEEDSFVSELKEYQESIKNSAIDIGDIDYDMSIIISLVYKESKVLESAKLGIRNLLKSKQNFIVANNLAQEEKEKAQKHMQVIAMVKRAINSFNIICYFQPIIDNKTQEIKKYESLVRLIDTDGKVLSPYFFLDVAKKGKYYSQITSMVLDNSFEALKNTTMDISINLSALDIELKSTREKLFHLLEKNKEHAHRVIFELLEDEGVKDFKTIEKFIKDVKELGVQIAIDDFGAGYSNFERLLEYQPDILKIDSCLIKDIETNEYSKSVVRTIVAFAKEQGIKTVAEFVENEEIFKITRDLGIDYSQGYFFGKPEALL